MLEVGENVGPYAVVRKLGEGGMGEVYLAQHRHIARRAAIKVLRHELSSQEDLVVRFFAEARAASVIRHPGIVDVTDCDVDPTTGRAFIVMELLEGEGLEACLGRVGPLATDLQAVGTIVSQIASALGAAHAAGIVHRDLKPANVFLTQGRPDQPLRVKILDFGVAKFAGPGSARHTRAGSLLGTPAYMSPEQCRGAGEVDHRADVYALGCILFELLCGRPPFVRDTTGVLLVAHLGEAPPLPSSLQPSVPPALDRLVARMLAKSPDERPQSMDEVLTLLGPALRPGAQPAATMVLPASPLAGLTKVLPVATSGMQTTLTDTAGMMEEQGAPPRRRRWWLLALPAIAAVAGAAVLLSRPATSGVPVAAPARAALRARPPAEPRTVAITIASDPPGAVVSAEGEGADEGERLGITPTVLRLREGETMSLRLALEGYAAESVSVGTERARVEVRLDRLAAPPRGPAARPEGARASAGGDKPPKARHGPATASTRPAPATT